MVLNDDFRLSGQTLEQFEKAASEMEGSTSYYPVRMDQLEVLSIADEDDENIYVYRLSKNPFTDKGAIRMLTEKRQKISKASILRRGEMEQAIREAVRVGMLLLDKPGHIYLVSKNALSTLAQRTGIGGDAVYDEFVNTKTGAVTTFARDLLIAQRLEGTAQLVLRSENGVNKIFSVMSEKYAHTEQKFFVDLVNRLNHDNVMGKVICDGWEITQDITKLLVTFPDKAQEVQALYGMSDYEPGILFETSDVGECAMRATAAWKHGGHIIFAYDVSRRHISLEEKDITEFIEDCKKNIFDRFTEMPEALVKQMMVTLTCRATDKRTVRANQKVLEEVLKKASKELGLVQVIRKGREKMVREQMLAEFDPTRSYTAYDITEELFSMPERLTGVTDEMIRNLRKAVSKAPYIDYGKKSAAPVVLTA